MTDRSILQSISMNLYKSALQNARIRIPLLISFLKLFVTFTASALLYLLFLLIQSLQTDDAQNYLIYLQKCGIIVKKGVAKNGYIFWLL